MGPGSCIFRALGIVGLLVAVAGGQFVLPVGEYLYDVSSIMKVHTKVHIFMNGTRLYFLGIVGLLVAAGAGAGGQFVLPGASHARLPGASTLGQIRAEIHNTQIRKYKHCLINAN